MSNGWVETLEAGSAEHLGRVVKAGLEQSGSMERDPLLGLGAEKTPASEEWGFSSEDALMAAGVTSADIGLKEGRWKVTPMVNMGPGRGWSGHEDAPEVVHEGQWSDEELGAAVIRAMDDAQRLSKVQPRSASTSPTREAAAPVPEDDGDLRYVSVTSHDGRVAVEALSASGAEDVPNGWSRLLADGTSDEELGRSVLEGLTEAGGPLPAEPVHPAASALRVGSDEELAVPGASRVMVEASVPGVLYVMATENFGPQEGFVSDEDPDQREVVDLSPAVVGMSVRLALEDAAG